MGETYKGFKTTNWYTVINGLGEGFFTSIGKRFACSHFWPVVSLTIVGFAHTHPIKHKNIPSGPDIWMKRLGWVVGLGIFPIAVFTNNTLSINHTVVKSLTIEAKDSTKTEGSNATYDLLPNVKEVLLRLRERKPPTSDYIFSHDDGTVLRPDSVTKAFSRVLKNNNLEHMRFHDIRHSTASLLFDMGMSLEDVKQWLRHSDIETTSNIYLHYTRTRKKITAVQVNDLFAV